MVLIPGETRLRNFYRDLQLELKFDKTIKAILGNQFITKDPKADLRFGTDFLIYSFLPFKCAVRLRRYEIYLKFPDEFTIRWKRPSGVPTEIDKIQAGHVRYFLYGFINPSESQIIKYFIGDLEVFVKSKQKPFAVIPNSPLDSYLGCFKIKQFPKEFVLKEWEKEAL